MKKLATVMVLSALTGCLIFSSGCGGGGTETKDTPANTESSTGSEGTMKKTSGGTSVDPVLQDLQDQADSGRMSWRANDPVAVAKETVVEGTNYTLISNDGTSKAQVDVDYPDKVIHVYLYKPVRQDATGIWAIERSEEAPK